MFVISQSDSYSWPVKVEIPVDGGKHSTQTFDAVFKRLSQTRIDDITKLASSDTLQDTDLAREVLVGWSGITDSDGNEFPFSESARDRLLDIPAVAGSVVRAFIASMSGAKRKN